jgi:hypothetical protein
VQRMRAPHSRSSFARFGASQFELVVSEGDISQWRPGLRETKSSCKCAAVVTPSNEALMGNRGYKNWWKFAGKKNADTFIHQKAGPRLQQHLNAFPEIEVRCVWLHQSCTDQGCMWCSQNPIGGAVLAVQ